MATVIPPTSNVEAAYEDMFKEITRKLYGEETGNGLHTLGTPVAQVATTGPTAAPEGEQRSFTNLQIDRSTQPTIEYEHNTGNVVGSAAAGSATSAAASAAAVIAAATNQQNATNVVIQQQPEGSVVVTTTTSTGGNFKSEDHLSTAFGLAALMQQNGFATTTGTILSSQAINKVITTAAGSQQPQQQQLSGDQQQQQQQQAWNEGAQDQQQQQQQTQPAPTTQIVQWTTTPSGKLQSYSTTTAQPQQTQQQQQVSTPKSKNKNRNEHNSTPSSNAAEVIYTSPTAASGNNNMSQQQTPQNSANTSSSSTTSTSSSGGSSGGGSRKKSHHNQNNQNNNNGQPLVQKRYACTHCPYSTDRRDLYTRHENIHKDEKPFQCYACLKQFNRADHVKKHFLRMHREMQYDINKTRRHVPSSNSAGGGHHHGGGRSNVTITATQANVNLEQAFLEQQRQPTSSSLSIAETIEAVATATDVPLPQLKQEKNDDGTLVGGQVVASVKPKREKRFTCCYCPWSGADKWGLKRHLNTHTKPFVCLLCDYKAARSERLATHVLKVHNKRACNKCSFLGDSLEEFQQHLNEVHPTAPSSRNTNSSSNTNTTTTNNNSTNNLNVLRTIGNTLGNNNQLNQFQNNNFSVNNVSTTTNGNSVTIYTTTTTDNQGGNITAGGPLQEIIVNPTSMVGWRLSANGSLIPPHDLLTGGLPNAATQKRGSERLFQYLEADGSDPEDYARLLKMDAISRNTASVAQDFHKAGGVQELKLPANHQLLFNNKLPSQWTTKEAAALLQSLSNANNLSYVYQQQQRSKYAHHQNGLMRQRQHSLGDDNENTPSSDTSTTTLSDDLSPLKMERSNGHNHSHSHSLQMTPSGEQKKSGSSAAFLHKSYDLQDSGLSNSSSVIHATDNSSNSSGHHYHDDQENQEQLIRSSPAYKNNNNNNNYYNNNNNNNNSNYNNNLNKIKSSNRNTNSNNNNNNNNHIQQQQQHQHRLDLHNKENNNNATFLTQMEFQNLNKIGTQFQNYVKDIISKYYAAETPVMFPNMPTPTATAQQSQQRLANQVSPKRKRLMSETEEYIEYLKNKEDITLTITPKLIANNQQQQQQQHHCKPQSPLKRERDLASDSYRRLSPKKTVITSTPQTPHQHKANKKSLNQLATLLPLLADAASQQQYLTAPLDFSKKPTQQPMAEVKQEVVKEEFTGITIIKEEPQDPIESQTAEIAYANFAPPPPPPQAATTPPPLNCSLMYDKRSSRKQAQPKKMRQPPDVVVAALRDKYLNRMVDHKLSCADCVKMKRSSMLVFNYHTKASLCLHRLWKHAQKPMKCRICGDKFGKRCSYILHIIRRHNDMKGTEKLLSPQS
ncbi:protein charlatan isoform X2 [Stomoxys calcitrans]|uniref:protein charlatan isoform X2 n=1 Tax=Stomoxys calcitrans TaxID=35570 RepID=UPI0027E28FB7|nr:protein charlatan isoform X2 [Stomoxys calcitrans]